MDLSSFSECTRNRMGCGLLIGFYIRTKQQGSVKISFIVGVIALARLFVGADDILHQTVTDNILVREGHPFDPFDPLENLDRLFQTGLRAGGQVDLGDIAGDDHLRVVAQTGQEHLHLLGGGVLSFVQDDKAVVEGPAAHIRQRSDLDVAAFKILLIGLCAEHVEQRVVQGSEIGIDLALQIAGQKAELLARFHGGSGQDDAVDFLGSKRSDRHRDRQIGLARTGRTDRDGDGVVLDRGAVALLTHRFRLDGLTLRRHTNTVGREGLDLLLAAVVDQRDTVGDVLLRELFAAVQKAQQAVDDLRRLQYALCFSRDLQLAVTRVHAYAELILDDFDVGIKAAEQRGGMFHTVYIDDLFHNTSSKAVPICLRVQISTL